MNRLSAQNHRYRIENMTTDEKMIDLIDKIYDNFESRTCDNCEFTWPVGDSYICNNVQAAIYRKQVKSTFGCNKFQPKQ